jgi:uncharacterized protein (DUF2147 family)
MNTLIARALVVATLFPGVAAAQGASPAGRWKTIDDKTGKPASIVEIAEVNGELQGKVLTVFSPPSDTPTPICDLCSGDLKNKPVIGMRILWGMKHDGAAYSGGRILDPDNGKIYRCNVTLVEGGKKLEVRGFIGISLLGRTQTWLREP